MGCAISYVSVLPGSSNPANSSSESPHVLVAGEKVIATRVSGEEVGGEVVGVSSSTLVLGNTDNYGYEEYRLDSNTLESIMWVREGSIWPYLAVIGVGTVVWSADQLSEID
jgi:hypothetical protein